MLRADHRGVEEARLVERATALGLLRRLLLRPRLRGLLLVALLRVGVAVAVLRRVRVLRLRIAVGVGGRGVGVGLLRVAVRIGLRGVPVPVGLRGVGLLRGELRGLLGERGDGGLGERREDETARRAPAEGAVRGTAAEGAVRGAAAPGAARRVVTPGGGLGRGVARRGEVGEVVGVAAVLAFAAVLAEGGEVVGRDAPVQLVATASHRVEGLGEHGLEGTELDVHVLVGAPAQRLGVAAALGSLGVVGVLVPLRVETVARAEELLAAPPDGAERLGEDDLEVGELAVDVVVGVGLDLGRLAPRLVEDAVRLALRLPRDGGVRDEAAALVVRAADDALGLGARLADHALALPDQLLRLGERTRQGLPYLLQHREQVGAVDHAGGRHGHGPGRVDDLDDLIEFLLHVHRVLATLSTDGETDRSAAAEPDGTTVRPRRGAATPGDVTSCGGTRGDVTRHVARRGATYGGNVAAYGGNVATRDAATSRRVGRDVAAYGSLDAAHRATSRRRVPHGVASPRSSPASSCVAPLPLTALPSLLREASREGGVDGRRQEVGDVAAPLRDLLDERGGEEAVGGVRRDEEGLDSGEAVVHLGHLQLVVEVADGAQALDDGGDVALLAEVDEEPVESLDLDVAELGGHLADQFHALVDREEPALGLVDHHGDVHDVVELGGSGDDVEMTVGDRVEGPRTDGAAQRDPLALRSIHGAFSHVEAARPYQKVPSP
ncbi:hypothetical protein STTU_1700 [Streptomyces sp. Tu6071]|nr:hypothetical protein STTU_1700 [Streptomyces sp. Tu6071]